MIKGCRIAASCLWVTPWGGSKNNRTENQPADECILEFLANHKKSPELVRYFI